MLQIERHMYKSLSTYVELQYWYSFLSFVLGESKGGIISFKCYSQLK